MDNRKRRRSKSKKSQENVQNTRSRMVFEDIEVPTVVEPHPECAICGQVIESISEAISEGGGKYSHFDCVLKKISEEEHIGENEKVSYVGHGSFAVVSKDEEGRFFIKKRIPYEEKETYEAMKKFVEGAKQ